ncbi:hypothetical protein A2X44_05115 [candidate division CPR3 bacterium GWF2_35_18]|uniref:Endonuclease/exonuclease/phosphatase n=1 Tax=candidate division CPR3 bacterium GW2011_GWF2_35_18 TaxID=1618350 RepID=A0A0G0ER86_UNCC3|nr:MAG: Endonuclease/exonuclease/phosphatase [candidate division CPR3 bacterium GW2011_GWF2_35_18]OGB63710.1 MAG: hypothetical protein A2X44_05115 [candidate division CPR3 bacterium GWF2_35_18]OGB64970.1 MAG: hypothetical protein A2250_00930 [candidate division CPR3 bacterium RIFOXYA2_FULL_35_13]OGB75533.1 MAG: hypothetical protein A2476_02510 [candidate division CPR3 bacterium RIFOXYC2_FULL_35_7]OGB78547.1 MAG: hypothetical protein A2296_02000 [candidate division CPR3 bacterium RIFOXYB2_FULL_3
MKKTIKLISLNIEGDNHLDKVIPFLVSENPDIICLQEVFKHNSETIANKIKRKDYFFPMAKMFEKRYTKKSLGMLWGISFLTNLEFKNIQCEQYFGNEKVVPSYLGGGGLCNRILAWGNVKKEGKEQTIATTHFTWSSKGNTTVIQRRSFNKLNKILDKVGDCVLCGDFNAPRGGEIFTALSKRFTDNIPVQVKTTVDENLHRKKGLQVVVDGLFTSSNYKAENVKIIGGVSDHKAIVATIFKI